MVGVTAALIGSAVIGAGTSLIAGSKASKAQKQAANTAAAAQDRASEVQKYIFDTTRMDYAPYQEVGVGALGKLADMYGVPRSTGPTGVPAPTNRGTSLPQQFGIQGFGRDGDFHSFLPGNETRTAVPASSRGMTPGFDGFEASPGYQFRVSEAMKAIERSAAARGNLRSGATMDALQRRVQGVASDEYENFANRLAALAGIGQTANAGSAAAGANYASGVAQGAAAQGNIALAAGNARASGYANTGNAVNQGIQNVASAYLYNRGWGGGGGPTSGWGAPGLH